MAQHRASDAGAPTMRDVAARAGVSAMTVSRVLKDDARVSGTTRERVLAAVEALGYRRNETARSLRLGGSGMIGLVVTNLANPFYSRLALGVQEVASEHGLRVLLSNTAEQADRERGLVEDLASRQVDGVIVVPAGSSHRHLAPAALRGMPIVLASRPRPVWMPTVSWSTTSEEPNRPPGNSSPTATAGSDSSATRPRSTPAPSGSVDTGPPTKRPG